MTEEKTVENQPETTIAKGLNVYQKINRIMQEVNYIHKDTKITLQRGGYTAVSYDGMIGRIRRFFCEQGVAVVPTIVSAETEWSRTKTNRGTLLSNSKDKVSVETYETEGSRIKMKVVTSFINVDNPKDRFSVDTYANSDDITDKGPGKAYTYAVKMALLKVLMLQSGDNEEEVIETKDELFTQMSVAQLAELRRLSIDTGTKESDILRAYSQDSSTNKTGLEAIHRKFYALIMAQLKQKLAKQKDYIATA